MQIIDFECDTPTKEAVEDTVRLIKSGRGFDKEGYAQQMAPGWAAQIGMSLEEFNEAKSTVGLTALALKLCEVDMTKAMSHAEVIAMLDGAGVAKACIGNAGRRASNEDVAAFAAEYPDRLIPWFRIWGDEGEAALEQGVRKRGVRGFEISSYRGERYINDPAYRPFMAKCVELNIPVRITVGVHLLSGPYDRLTASVRTPKETHRLRSRESLPWAIQRAHLLDAGLRAEGDIRLPAGLSFAR